MVESYVIYNELEELVFEGTSKECCKYLNITIGSFYSFVTRSSNGIRKKYLIYKVE